MQDKAKSKRESAINKYINLRVNRALIRGSVSIIRNWAIHIDLGIGCHQSRLWLPPCAGGTAFCSANSWDTGFT